jgi:hypothetical protein
MSFVHWRLDSTTADTWHVDIALMIDYGLQFIRIRITVLQLLSVARSALHRRSYNVDSTLTVGVCLQPPLLSHSNSGFT